MQEQQGNLEEPLSGLPGPRPFDRKNKKGVPMENNNKELNDIVARATEHLTSGKAFGGWTDKVDESAFKQMQVDREHKAKKIKAQRERESAGSSNSTPNSTSDSSDTKKKAKEANLGSATKKGGIVKPVKPLPGLLSRKDSLGEKVATPPRQLKDKKTEVLVHDSKGKVKTIDRKDLEQYQKDNPGSGSIVPGVGTIIGGLLGYALGDAGAAVTGIGKKKKNWDNK